LSAAVVAAAFAAVGVMVWHGQQPDSRAVAPSDAIAIIRGGRVAVSSTLRAADAIAVAPGGDAWVASTQDGTITRVSPAGAERAVGIGGRPTDVAWGFGKLWVGDAAGRRLVAYDPALDSVVLSVLLAGHVGPIGQPAAHVALGAGSVWVDNGGLAGVWRIDPTTGQVTARIHGVQTGAITYGGGAVWVAGNFVSGDRVDRIDPSTNTVSGSIPLPSGTPVSIAFAGGQLWVVCDDGTLWRVDARTRRGARVPVSGLPVSVAGSGNTVWVAQRDPARVVQIGAASSHPLSVVPLAGTPTATAATAQGTWVTTVPTESASGQPHGDVITVALNTGIDSIDPALSEWATVWQIEYATGLRLLTYPDLGGVAGTQLIPDGATALPVVTNNGRTYTFAVRHGLRFWPGGQPVTAAAFRAAVERALSPNVNSSFGLDFMGDLVGIGAYRHHRTVHIGGIQLHGRYRIAFTTTTPDPSFPVNIAMPMYSAVLPTTPDAPATRPLPSAGPYYIARYRPGRLIVLQRNPGYPGPRPAVLGDIRYRLGNAHSQAAWQQVVDARADVDADSASSAQLEQLRSHGGSPPVRVTVSPLPELHYLVLNTRSPALRNALVRQAISNAIDRRKLAATIGHGAAVPTDQYLTPAVAGYPGSGLVYPLDRSRFGVARTLLRAAGVHVPLTVRMSTCNDPVCTADGMPARAALLRTELGKIGIRLTVRKLTRDQQLAVDASGTGFDIADEGFDFPNSDPQTMEFAVGVEAGYRPTASMHAAERTAYPRRAAVWRAVDLALARGASPLTAYAITNTINITSNRVGCLVYQPEYGLDLGRLCLAKIGTG
jgi:ABC-type transport system substrate-binding protein